MAISSPYPAQRGFFHVSESDTLALLAQRIPAAASPRKNLRKTSDAYPLHSRESARKEAGDNARIKPLPEGAVYTAGTCCANNFSLFYSLQILFWLFMFFLLSYSGIISLRKGVFICKTVMLLFQLQPKSYLRNSLKYI